MTDTTETTRRLTQARALLDPTQETIRQVWNARSMAERGLKPCPIFEPVKTDAGMWQIEIAFDNGAGAQKFIAPSLDLLVGKMAQSIYHGTLKIREYKHALAEVVTDTYLPNCGEGDL